MTGTEVGVLIVKIDSDEGDGVSLREVCPFGRRRIDAHESIHELPFPHCYRSHGKLPER